MFQAECHFIIVSKPNILDRALFYNGKISFLCIHSLAFNKTISFSSKSVSSLFFVYFSWVQNIDRKDNFNVLKAIKN